VNTELEQVWATRTAATSVTPSVMLNHPSPRDRLVVLGGAALAGPGASAPAELRDEV
jgi:hypothetical protein